MEANIEEVLTEHELYYEKSEVWIETEKMYEPQAEAVDTEDTGHTEEPQG